MSGKITLPALTTYTQATSNTTNVSISGAEQQFLVSTFETSPGVGGDIAAGASLYFQLAHAEVIAGKTIVLIMKAGSYNGLALVNDFVSATSAGLITITRHNFGTTTASGTQQLIFKLIQTK